MHLIHMINHGKTIPVVLEASPAKAQRMVTQANDILDAYFRSNVYCNVHQAIGDIQDVLGPFWASRSPRIEPPLSLGRDSRVFSIEITKVEA